MNRVLSIITGIIAVIPGLATLRNGLWAPEKYKFLFGGFIEFFCALSLLILWTRRSKIKQILPATKLKLTLLFVFIFLLSTSTYIFLINKTDINHSSRGSVFFPISLTGDLKSIVDKSGSRLAAIENYGIDEINEQLDKQPDINFTITILTLLAVYTILFVCLTLTFGINSIEYDSS
jgi:hypothetical protein